MILLTVAYDGRHFSGWAMQEGARTVAGELLGAIRHMDPAVEAVRGVSRTDAGVHARGQLAAFRPTRTIAPRGWALGLVAHLPEEITIRQAARVIDARDPRGHTVRKRYRYLVLRDAVRDPFWVGRAMRCPHALDLDLLRREAATLVGTHDFRAFRSSADTRTNTVRTIESVGVAPLLDDPRVLAIDVVGNAFMHNMVRIIVGALLDVARARLPAGTLGQVLANGTRSDLGMTAPPDGLYLEQVDHTLELADIWP